MEEAAELVVSVAMEWMAMTADWAVMAVRAETGAGPTVGKLAAADSAVMEATAVWAVTRQPSQLATGGPAATAVQVVLAGPRSVALPAMAD